jgi:hypothetical protein
LLITQASIAKHNDTVCKFNTNEIFNEINKWFYIMSNLLILNYDETYFFFFLTKTDYEINMEVSFAIRKIVTAQSLKFLGPTIETSLTWKHHIGELTFPYCVSVYRVICLLKNIK